MTVRPERARVLNTVKASPQPSAKYGDTVCVAGIRVDGNRREWVRLYPLPFRWIGMKQQFRKFDLIELDIHRATGDSRPESYRPNIDSIEVVSHLDDWKDRQRFMEGVPHTTTCTLSAAASEFHGAPSLGMVDVASIQKLSLYPLGRWTEEQERRMAAAANLSPLALFGGENIAPRELKAPRFTAKYEYRCTSGSCPGHVGQILDWELTALQGRLHRESDAEVGAKIRQQFLQMMFQPERRTSFFMGNFEDARKRHSFSVLGIYYPPERIASSVGLFDLPEPLT